MTAPLQFPMSPALEKAAIKKVLAEAKVADLSAKALQMEIDASDIKIADARAELRAAEARALEAEYEAETARISTALNLRQEKYTLAQEHYNNTMTFAATVDAKSVGAALTQLNVWDRQDPECDMNIFINSGGGDAILGLHLFDQLTAYSLRGRDGKGLGGGRHKVTVTVRGQAASMAGILLQAADVRRMGPESWLMIHEVSAGTGGKVGEIKDDYEFFQHMCDRIANVFVQRSKGKIKLAEFQAGWKSKNWWLDSEKALKLGFVDEIG